MRAAIASCILYLLLSVPAAAADRPAWCQPGYQCIKTAELAEDTIWHINMQEELAKARVRGRRFGFTLGCGVGIAGVVNKDFETQTAPALACGAFYGLRW